MIFRRNVILWNFYDTLCVCVCVWCSGTILIASLVLLPQILFPVRSAHSDFHVQLVVVLWFFVYG